MAEEKQGPDGVNVQVLVRCRPVSEREVVERTPQVIACNEALREVTLFQNAGGKQLSKTFRFDRVFGPDSAQEKLFKQAIIPIVQEVMDGFNCTIFAYGQTGTGKTYTMEGGPRDSSDGRNLSAEAGVIPRSIKQIFDTIEANNMDSNVKVSFLELYNEELTDLLSFEDDKEAAKKLRLLEDRSGVVVHGLEEVIVRSATEIYQVLDRGTAKRRTAATLLNNRSSRSHSIFTITIHLKESTPEGEDVIKIGKLNLVDLAGSENISRSGAKDARAREAGSINQSLLTLGRVITTLVEHSGHVPYRDSKLTRLLRDSLGGRTKTCIIATIAPTVQCQEETISTLDYAHRAKNIRNKPELNQKISKTTMIKELAAEIERLRVDLSCTREKNGVYLPMDRYEQGEMERVQLRDTVRALKAEMELEEATHAKELEQLRSSHEQEVDAVQAELDAASQQLASTQDQLSEAQIQLQERQFMILSHQRAEHALAAYGQKLTVELAAAAADLEQLFAKFGEVLDMQRGDRSALHGLGQYVQSRMEQMGAFVTRAAKAQHKYLEEVAADALALKTKKEAHAVQLNAQVSECEAHGGELQAAYCSGVTDLAALFESSLRRSRALSGSFSTRAAAGLQAARDSAVGGIQALVSGMELQAAQVQALGGRSAGAVQASVEALHSLGAAAQQQLAEASVSLEQLQGGVSLQHQSADKAISAAAVTLEASVQQQQAALLQQIGSMVSAFAAERSREVAAALQGVRQQVAGAASSTSEAAGGIAQSMAAAAAKIKDSEAAMSAAVTSGGLQLGQEVSAVHCALQQLGSQGAGAVPGLQGLLDSQEQLLQGYTQELSEQLDLSAGAGSATRDAACATAARLGSELAQACQGLHASVQGQHAEDVAAAGAIHKVALEATQKLQEFSSACTLGAGETSQCVVREVGQQLGKEVALGGVPAQRTAEVPGLDAVHELLCPPEHVVLQQYRREKAQILRHGGDVRYTSLLLSSPQLKLMSPPAAVTVRGPRSPLSSAASQENQMLGSPMCMDSAQPAGGKLAAGSPLKPSAAAGAAAVQLQRSKIPGAPAPAAGAGLFSPGKARGGLVDKTNL